MFAIISIGNKQYKVEENSVIYVEKLENAAGDKITISDVLLVDNEIGTPYVKGAQVVCEVEKQVKAEKINIIKHISQKHHTKRMGHRQQLTKLIVKQIIK
ncbi:MAG: 50S ribosomal protein L21 [Mycoplasmataceae bacterium]|jgi:large subunit ribosomal protein L21|nr:50S ribosomal protein L21 [Mycoplasmataceae bacterium]